MDLAKLGPLNRNICVPGNELRQSLGEADVVHVVWFFNEHELDSLHLRSEMSKIIPIAAITVMNWNALVQAGQALKADQKV